MSLVAPNTLKPDDHALISVGDCSTCGQVVELDQDGFCPRGSPARHPVSNRRTKPQRMPLDSKPGGDAMK